MKYLKRIFESLDKDELKDFCETNLAYLLDDPDFEIRIEDTDWKKPSRFVSVVLCKTVDLGSGQMMRTTFEWGEVKDHVVPFVIQLHKNYKFDTSGSDNGSVIEVRQRHESREFTYEKFIRVVDNWYEDDDEIQYIEIMLENDTKEQESLMRFLKGYNESAGGVDNVKEFCSNYLANLLDDTTYQLSVTSQMSDYRVSPSYFVCLTRSISHDGRTIEGAQDIIQWNDVKDHIIPFLHMLIREYQIEPMRLIDQSKLTYQTKNVYIDDNPRNRTIQFNRYLPDTYSSDLYYMDVRNVIKDEDVPEQFYRIQIQFY
jgi:hypothetical protein